MAKKTRKAVPSSQFLMVAALSAAFVLSLFVFNYPKQAQKSSAATTAPTTTTTTQVNGNGAPNGAHYNLNIIGVPKGKTATMTGGDAHRIFVPLVGNCKISLSMGAFQVLDGNCTDGPSSFQLPNPDPDNDGTTTYSVWARALGKPGGSSTQTTCAPPSPSFLNLRKMPKHFQERKQIREASFDKEKLLIGLPTMPS